MEVVDCTLLFLESLESTRSTTRPAGSLEGKQDASCRGSRLVDPCPARRGGRCPSERGGPKEKLQREQSQCSKSELSDDMISRSLSQLSLKEPGMFKAPEQSGAALCDSLPAGSVWGQGCVPVRKRRDGLPVTPSQRGDTKLPLCLGGRSHSGNCVSRCRRREPGLQPWVGLLGMGLWANHPPF